MGSRLVVFAVRHRVLFKVIRRPGEDWHLYHLNLDLDLDWHLPDYGFLTDAEFGESSLKMLHEVPLVRLEVGDLRDFTCF